MRDRNDENFTEWRPPAPSLHSLAGINRNLFASHPTSSLNDSSRTAPLRTFMPRPTFALASQRRPTERGVTTPEPEETSEETQQPRTPVRQRVEYQQPQPRSRPVSAPYVTNNNFMLSDFKSPLRCASSTTYSTPNGVTHSPYIQPVATQRPQSAFSALVTPHKSLTTSPRSEITASGINNTMNKSSFQITANAKGMARQATGFATIGRHTVHSSVASSLTQIIEPSKILGGASILARGVGDEHSDSGDEESEETLENSSDGNVCSNGVNRRQPIAWGNEAVGLVIVTKGQKVHLIPEPLNKGGKIRQLFEVNQYYSTPPSNGQKEIEITAVATSRGDGGRLSSERKRTLADFKKEIAVSAARLQNSPSISYDDQKIFSGCAAEGKDHLIDLGHHETHLVNVRRELKMSTECDETGACSSLNNTPLGDKYSYTTASVSPSSRRIMLSPRVSSVPFYQQSPPRDFVQRHQRQKPSTSMQFPRTLMLPCFEQQQQQTTPSKSSPRNLIPDNQDGLRTPVSRAVGPSHSSSIPRGPEEAERIASFVAIGLSNGCIHVFSVVCCREAPTEREPILETRSDVLEIIELPKISTCDGERITSLSVTEKSVNSQPAAGITERGAASILLVGTSLGGFSAYELKMPSGSRAGETHLLLERHFHLSLRDILEKEPAAFERRRLAGELESGFPAEESNTCMRLPSPLPSPALSDASFAAVVSPGEQTSTFSNTEAQQTSTPTRRPAPSDPSMRMPPLALGGPVTYHAYAYHHTAPPVLTPRQHLYPPLSLYDKRPHTPVMLIDNSCGDILPLQSLAAEDSVRRNNTPFTAPSAAASKGGDQQFDTMRFSVPPALSPVLSSASLLVQRQAIVSSASPGVGVVTGCVGKSPLASRPPTRPFSSPKLSPPPPLPPPPPPSQRCEPDAALLRGGYYGRLGESIEVAESATLITNDACPSTLLSEFGKQRNSPIVVVCPSPCGDFIAVGSVDGLVIIENTLNRKEVFNHCPTVMKLRECCSFPSAQAVAWLASAPDTSSAMVAFADVAHQGRETAAPKGSVLKIQTLKNNLVCESFDTGCEILSISPIAVPLRSEGDLNKKSPISGSSFLSLTERPCNVSDEEGRRHVDLVLALGAQTNSQNAHTSQFVNRLLQRRLVVYRIQFLHNETRIFPLFFLDTGLSLVRERGVVGTSESSRPPKIHFISESPSTTQIAALTGGTDQSLRLWSLVPFDNLPIGTGSGDGITKVRSGNAGAVPAVMSARPRGSPFLYPSEDELR